MKRLILILAIAILSVGSLFAQTIKTEINAIRIKASGEITGMVKEVPNTSDASITLTRDSCLNIIHTNADADAIGYILPVAEFGLATGFLDDAGGAMTVDPDGSEYIVIDGTSAGAGTAVVSDGTRGRYMVLLGRDGYWTALPTNGWE